MSSEVWVVVGTVVVLLAVTGVVLSSAYVRVESGKALVINKVDRTEVSFTGAVVLPIVQRGELMDVSLKTLSLDRRGKEGLVCGDKIRADISAQFFVRVNPTADDVLQVARAVGCARASDPSVLEELFVAKFAEALKTVAAQLDFEQLHRERGHFRDRVLEVIGTDLNGYALEDLSIDALEQTPLEQLDPGNILDATGIKKIVEVSERRKVERVKIEAEAHQRRLQLEAHVADLERVKADALARLRAETGKTLSEVDLRERIAALIVEHYGPRIDAAQARALVDADEASSSAPTVST